jgi:hypothetical protein
MVNEERFNKVVDALQKAASLADTRIRFGHPGLPNYKLEYLVLDAWNLCWPSETPKP